MRAITSAKLTPHAATSMRTSPRARAGSLRSCTCSFSGPPWPVMTTARTPTALAALAEIDGPAGVEAVLVEYLAQDLRGDGGVGRDDHRGEPRLIARARAGAGAVAGAEARGGVGRVPDGGRGDVDAVRAEDGADAADHAGQILVAEDGDVRLEL